MKLPWQVSRYSLHKQIDLGKGTKLVFLHGLGSSGRYWKEVINYLDSKKNHCISYDLLGFGESPKPEPFEYKTSQQADSLRKALWRNIIFGKITLIGHSYGALVALEFARRYPQKVDQLIITNVPFLFTSTQHKLVRTRYKNITYTVGNYIRQRALHKIQGSKLVYNKVMPKYAYKRIKQGVFDEYDMRHISEYAYLQSIKSGIQKQTHFRVRCPVTLIVADKDRAVIKSNIEVVKKIIPQLKVIHVRGTHQFPRLKAMEFAEIIRCCLG